MKTFLYEDHVGLWENEIRSWLPSRVFDAHVHVGKGSFVRPITPERARETCTTFSCLSYELLREVYAQVYSGVEIEGLIAFPFPIREVDYFSANRYIEEIATADRSITGFILSNPHDTAQTVGEFRAAEKRGFRFRGVKPYYDLVGKDIPRSNFYIRNEEFIPDALLDFMNGEHLAMMLHTGLGGMGDPDCQAFVRRVAEKYPNIPVMLAHMGRYTDPAEYIAFNQTDLLDHPSIYVETSSASVPEVYHHFFARKDRWEKLVFGSDLPFGLITGVEHTTETEKAIFLSRDIYPWSNAELAERYAEVRNKMTYNTYHTLLAVKTAMDELKLSGADEAALKEQVFRGNVSRFLARTRAI